MTTLIAVEEESDGFCAGSAPGTTAVVKGTAPRVNEQGILSQKKTDCQSSASSRMQRVTPRVHPCYFGPPGTLAISSFTSIRFTRVAHGSVFRPDASSTRKVT